MDQPILARAVWFDDEWDKDFIDNAAEKGIIVIPHDSNTEGLAYLKANYKDVDAVILDAWGRIMAGSGKAEDPEALGHAKDELQDLAIKHGYAIPQCIYTGYMDRLDQVTGRTRKFSKKANDDLDALFAWVLDQAETRGVTTTQTRHAEVFRVFEENLLPEDKKWDLVKLLKDMDTMDASSIKANNGLARTFIEPIVEGLNTLGSQYMPNELLAGGRVNADGAMRYLTGQPLEVKEKGVTILTLPKGDRIVPEHLSWMLSTIFKTPTFTGSHDYREKHTPYAHRAVVNALCELLIWYHDFIMSKRKK